MAADPILRKSVHLEDHGEGPCNGIAEFVDHERGTHVETASVIILPIPSNHLRLGDDEPAGTQTSTHCRFVLNQQGLRETNGSCTCMSAHAIMAPPSSESLINAVIGEGHPWIVSQTMSRRVCHIVDELAQGRCELQSATGTNLHGLRSIFPSGQACNMSRLNEECAC